MVTELVFLVWLMGFIVCFITLCRVERKKPIIECDGAANIIFISIAWPLMVLLVVGLSPIALLVWTYEKLVGER